MAYRSQTFYCCLSFCLGLVLSYILIRNPTSLTLNTGYSPLGLDGENIRAVSKSDKIVKNSHLDWDYHEAFDKEMHRIKEDGLKDQEHHNEDDSEARRLKDKVRVLCWIMTGPQNLDTKAIHVKRTWATRCNVLLFMSSVTNASFPTVGLDVFEGRQHLTAKTMQAFKYIYDHHFNDADWFMKADDDTYVIVENLRYFLSDKSPDKAVYYGHHFAPGRLTNLGHNGYFSGGAGYVLSKEALSRLAKNGETTELCRQDGGAEDLEMGKCMQNLNVTLGDSTDSLGRSRFHCFVPESFIHGRFPKWFQYYDAQGSKSKSGLESISDYAVSFHYVRPDTMYSLEFYVYHLRPYGITSHGQDLNVPPKSSLSVNGSSKTDNIKSQFRLMHVST